MARWVLCLRVLNGAVSINQSMLTANSGLVRIQQGDEISVGNLAIKSHISRSNADMIDPLMVSPESLVSSYSNPLEAMMEGAMRSLPTMSRTTAWPPRSLTVSATTRCGYWKPKA